MCQVAYLVDGLKRFKSDELKTPREHSSYTLEHTCKALLRTFSKGMICASWRGVIFVKKTALDSSGDSESKVASTTAAVDAVQLWRSYETPQEKNLSNGMNSCAYTVDGSESTIASRFTRWGSL